MKNIFMAALLISGINVYGTEFPSIQGLMVVNRFEEACVRLRDVISASGASDEDMHAYACVAALNHLILKKPTDATVFMELADDFQAKMPSLPLENRYLHFLARHAYAPNQTTFNSQIIKLTQEKSDLSPERKEDFSKKTKMFLNICVDKIEDLDNEFVHFASCPDKCVSVARTFIEAKQYQQAWDVFKERMKTSIKIAGEVKREKITKLLQEHRSSMFQSFLSVAFDADDYKTAGVLCDMLMRPGERHSSVRLGGLTYYALRDIDALKDWVNKVVFEISHSEESILLPEIFLDQAFCVFTAHSLYQHLKLKNNQIETFYKSVMGKLEEETKLTWQKSNTDFIIKIEELNKQQALLAQKAEEELLNQPSGFPISGTSTSSSKKSKKKERVRREEVPFPAVAKVVDPEEVARSRLANVAHEQAQSVIAREKEEARKKRESEDQRARGNKAAKDARKSEEEARIRAIEAGRQSLPPLEFTVNEDKTAVILTSGDGDKGLWIPVSKHKEIRRFCKPSSFPSNALGFIYEKDGEKIFYPLPS